MYVIQRVNPATRYLGAGKEPNPNLPQPNADPTYRLALFTAMLATAPTATSSLFVVEHLRGAPSPTATEMP